MLTINDGTAREAYNVGTGKTTDFNTIIRIVKEEIDYQPEAEYVPNLLKSYQMYILTCITKARKELRFKIRYDLRNNVKK